VRHLSSDQPVYGLQALGLDGKQEPLNSVKQMAAHYVKEIRDFQPEGPYYLVGDTLGGLFALEMAQQLTEQGQKVALLAMFDTACPLPEPVSLRKRIVFHTSHFKDLGAKEYLLAAALAVKKRLAKRVSGTIPLTVEEQAYLDRAAQDPLHRIEAAIYHAAWIGYIPPRRSYPGRITYFLALDNRYNAGEKDNRLRWKEIAGGGFEVHPIPGSHETIKEEPHVAVLAHELTACLERAQAGRRIH
jgi:thioesterase domain-containing protein